MSVRMRRLANLSNWRLSPTSCRVEVALDLAETLKSYVKLVSVAVALINCYEGLLVQDYADHRGGVGKTGKSKVCYSWRARSICSTNCRQHEAQGGWHVQF